MTVYIKYSNHLQLVEGGYGYRIQAAAPDHSDFGLYYDVLDILLNRLWGQEFFLPLGPISLASLVGLADSSSFDVKTLEVPFKPENYGYNFNAYEQNYDSFLRNLAFTGRTLLGRPNYVPSPIGEHVLRHASLRGTLIAKQVRAASSLVDFTFGDQTFKVRQLIGTVRHDTATPSALLPLTLSVNDYNWGDTSLSYYLSDVFDYLVGHDVRQIVPYFGDPTYMRRGIYDCLLSDFSYTNSTDSVVVSYRMKCTLGSLSYSWTSTATFPRQGRLPQTAPSIGVHSPDFTTAPAFWHWTSAESTDPDYPAFSQDSVPRSSWGYPFPLSIPNPVDSLEGNKAVSVANYLTSVGPLGSFRRAIDLSYRDITTSALFSTVDAFKNAEGSLGTNILQDLQKLPDIVNQLPQIREAVSIMSKLLKRDLSLATLKDIADLTSSTILTGSFVWRPYIGLMTDYLPRMISTLHSMGFSARKTVGYGTFSFKFSNEFGRDETSLVTRTKLVIDASFSSLLSASLGLDALGVLPKVSRLWDLLPFTFVVNWFTGIGTAIQRAEYSLILATLPAYYVHTYTLTSPITDKDMSSTSFTPFDNSGSLRVHYRDVSLYSPAPRDSRFGFGIPTSLPPLGVVGSLLYQVIFA